MIHLLIEINSWINLWKQKPEKQHHHRRNMCFVRNVLHIYLVCRSYHDYHQLINKCCAHFFSWMWFWFSPDFVFVFVFVKSLQNKSGPTCAQFAASLFLLLLNFKATQFHHIAKLSFNNALLVYFVFQLPSIETIQSPIKMMRKYSKNEWTELSWMSITQIIKRNKKDLITTLQ